MQPLIDQERERLYKAAQKWGFCDERTLEQSKRVDNLVYKDMSTHRFLQIKDKKT